MPAIFVRADDRDLAVWPDRPIRVAVLAMDPLTRAGLRSELRDRPRVELLDDPAEAEVVVAVADAPIRDLLPVSTCQLVLVADQPRPAELLAAVEHGLAVLVPRAEATAPRLLRAIVDAHRGFGDVPPEQLGHLLRGLSELHREILGPRDLTLAGLSYRETDVLRLLAEGFDTAHIAAKLSYSDRTVKNILQGVLGRLDLHNRTHAVAHAMRLGLI
jgi:DNA-binding NarL/FixJ family response regulator